MLMQVLGTVFRLGLGGRMGSGRQYWPWISLADEIGAIRHLLTADVSGPVNLTGPDPVTNAEFTAELGRQLHRPTVLPGARRSRSRWRSASSAGPASSAGSGPCRCGCRSPGYRFTHPDLASALRAALGRAADRAQPGRCGALDPPAVRRSGPAPSARRSPAAAGAVRSAAPSGPAAATTS